jgi:hypothetical protein
MAVAEDAGVRGQAGTVGVQEVLQNFFAEIFAQITDLPGDGDRPGQVFDPGQFFIFARQPQAHGQCPYRITLFTQEQYRGRGILAAAESDGHGFLGSDFYGHGNVASSKARASPKSWLRKIGRFQERAPGRLSCRKRVKALSLPRRFRSG